MNEKWEHRRRELNRERMILVMSQIQENMLEISRVVHRGVSVGAKDTNRFTDFKEYSENLLNNIKNKS